MKKQKIKDSRFPKINLIPYFIALWAVVFVFVTYNLVLAIIPTTTRVSYTKEEFLAKAGDINIPIIEINTLKKQEPYNKEDYVDCSVSISNCDDELEVSMGEAGIRLRGNSTMTAPKKPYRIKFEKKQSLLGSEEKFKSWVLLADYFDQSSIRNFAAFSLGSKLDNLHFTPTAHHVALIMNGEFRGLYLLTDQVDEKDGRTSVEEDVEDMNINNPFDTIPFLVEVDEKALSEGVTGVDNFDIDFLFPAEIKYPESDERVDGSFDYIKEYVTAVFATLKSGEKMDVSFSDTPVGFEDLVDVDSFIDYYLMAQIMVNLDAGKKSIYIHKPAGEKLQFGPIWDYDFSMAKDWHMPYTKGESELANRYHFGWAFYHWFMKSEANYNKVANRFFEIKDHISDVVKMLGEYKSTIDNIALIDAEIWYGNTGEFQFDMQYSYVRIFLLDRKDFLEELFSQTYNEFIA